MPLKGTLSYIAESSIHTQKLDLTKNNAFNKTHFHEKFSHINITLEI